MKRNYMTHCLVGVVAAAGLLLAFGVQIGTLAYLGVALACPLLMVFMMRGMVGGGHGGCDHPDHEAPVDRDTAERTR